MTSLWLTVLGLINGAVSLFNKVLDYIRSAKLISQGKSLEQAEIAKQESEAQRKASEVLAEDRTREQTAKRMDEGTF